jgi:nucleotide-binding universal stress UspA family protein
MFHRILVTTDNSDLSRKAVRAAIDLAAATKAALYVLHVVPRYPTSYFEGAVVLAPDEVGRIEKQWSDAGHALVDSVTKEAKAAGVHAKGVVGQGDSVAEAIISSAGKHECDLIVMASHGRRGMARVLLGSETQHVLTHSSIPVLVLR